MNKYLKFSNSDLTGINPIQKLLYILAYPIAKISSKFGLTPNILTLISFIFTILAFISLVKNYLLSFISFWFVAFILDYADGTLARMTNSKGKTALEYDHISDLLFSPTIECVKNLEHENVLGKIYCVGNTVADAALRFKPKKIVKTKNILLTLHREENVDDNQILKHLLIQIEEILDHCDLNAEFFIHPRTKKRLDEFNLWSILSSRISIKSPLNYLGFLQKICESKFILTDSGGLQEEACILGTPCYTLRKSTERPETVECGANLVLGVDEPAKIFKKSNLILTNKDWLSPFGDGHTANHIVKNSIEWLKENNL